MLYSDVRLGERELKIKTETEESVFVVGKRAGMRHIDQIMTSGIR